MSAIYVRLLIGKTKALPAPARLAESLARVEVEQSDEIPNGFQLVFDSELDASKNEFALFSDPLLEEFNRVAIAVTVDGKDVPLIDGFIVNRELDPEQGKIVVTGEDVSAKMDLIELVQEYPKKKDSQIVKQILGPYRLLGLTPKVKAPKNEIAPTDTTPTQRSTDRVYLQRLAEKNQAIFYVEAGKAPGLNTVYWGPPVRTGKLQKALTAASGAMWGNIEGFSASSDALAPQMSYGESLVKGSSGPESKTTDFVATDAFKKSPLAKDRPDLPDFAALAKQPDKARQKIAKLKVRGSFMRQQGLTPAGAEVTAASETERSAADATTLTGELDTARYGAVLKSPGMVGVRGAGKSYSGEYYVKKVRHVLDLARREKMQYTQSFTLTREGPGARKTKV